MRQWIVRSSHSQKQEIVRCDSETWVSAYKELTVCTLQSRPSPFPTRWGSSVPLWAGDQLTDRRRSSRTVSRQRPSSWAMRLRTARVCKPAEWWSAMLARFSGKIDVCRVHSPPVSASVTWRCRRVLPTPRPRVRRTRTFRHRRDGCPADDGARRVCWMRPMRSGCATTRVSWASPAGARPGRRLRARRRAVRPPSADGDGVERVAARAVIDASGTWGGPNLLGRRACAHQ